MLLHDIVSVLSEAHPGLPNERLADRLRPSLSV
jgi:hypothetical protein